MQNYSKVILGRKDVAVFAKFVHFKSWQNLLDIFRNQKV